MRREERKKILLRLGFVLVRNGGSHTIYEHPETGVRSVLPSSSKDRDKRGWLNERARLRREGFDI